MDRTARLQQQVECPVCMEEFQTPKTLPCQHSGCLRCLQRIHDNDSGPRVKCPECRTEHSIPANGIAGFPTSVSIQRLIEVVNQPNTPRTNPPTPSNSRQRIVLPAVPSIPKDIEEEDGISRLIELANQQEKIDNNLQKNKRILQARQNRSSNGRLELHQHTQPMEETYRAMSPINSNSNKEPTFACTDRSSRNKNTYRTEINNYTYKQQINNYTYQPQMNNYTYQSQTKPFPVLEPIQSHTSKYVAPYDFTNQAQVNPNYLPPINPYPVLSPIYPYSGMVPINTNPYMTPINTNPFMTPINTNTCMTPINTNTGMVPINTNTDMVPINTNPFMTPINTNPYIVPSNNYQYGAPSYTNYCTPPNMSFQWHGGF